MLDDDDVDFDGFDSVFVDEESLFDSLVDSLFVDPESLDDDDELSPFDDVRFEEDRLSVL